MSELRGLVVGLGSIGRRHARNWAALQLGPLAVCRQLGRPLPEPLGLEVTQYSDLDQALELAQPDLVVVANPTSLHVETACRAVGAGAHVLVEKPLDSDLGAVAGLLRAAQARGRALMVAYNLRFHPLLARLKSLVTGGAIGRVLSARAEAGEYLPDWHPWEDYRGGYSGRRDLGGGAVLTMSHELDALCWLMGAPRRVTALAGHLSALEIDAEDVAEIVVEFEGGAIGSVHLDYVRRTPTRKLEVVGENGLLRWDYHANRLEQYTASTGQWRVEEGDLRYARNQMYVDELRHFAGCARGELGRPLIDGEQGAAVLALALAALRSAEEGRTIDLVAGGDPTRTWLRSFSSEHGEAS